MSTVALKASAIRLSRRGSKNNSGRLWRLKSVSDCRHKADGVGKKTELRHFQDTLGERFAKTPGREVENLLPFVVIRVVDLAATKISIG